MAVTQRRVTHKVALPAVVTVRSMPPRWRGIAAAGVVVVVVAVLAQLPLINNHIFYYWDDSAAAFLPDWYHIGTLLRAGHWPVLAPDMWAGGNFAAEAMLGLFNPVSLANDILVSLLPDLALAAAVVKTEFLVLLAIGIYLLAREYGATRTASVVVATALPFAGYTLYFDASAWVGGLIGFAWVPLFWWSAHRFSTRGCNPIGPLVFGYLGMSVGSPYGALGIMIVLLAVGAELALQRRWRRFGQLVAVAVVIGMSTLVVYLPLVGSSAVTWRTDGGVFNDGTFVPHLSDLLASAAPTFQPLFVTFGTTVTTFPCAYLAWFVVPLLPWVSWSALWRRIARWPSVAIFGLVYLLCWIGPSNLWLFRWPARLTEYLYLPIGVLVALALTDGPRTSMPARRALASAILVAAGTYLSVVSAPAHVRAHILALVLVVGLLVATALAWRRGPTAAGGVLVLGTALVLAVQVSVYPANDNITPWRFPHNVALMKADYGTRYAGNTLQIADAHALAEVTPLIPAGAWRDVLLGSGIHVAGVPALNAYTGVGDVAFSDALCMNYYGGTCADAYARLWRTAPGTTTTLADVLRLNTVVLLTGYHDGGPLVGGHDDQHVDSHVDRAAAPVVAPAGWSVVRRTAVTTVLRRDQPLPWPAGRLSWAGQGVTVASDIVSGTTDERVTYRGQGRVVFAALAWPGWRATVDGAPVLVKQGPAGLIEVELPPSTPATHMLELSFTPPGFSFGLPLAGLGALLGLSYAGVTMARRRIRRITEQPEELRSS